MATTKAASTKKATAKKPAAAKTTVRTVRAKADAEVKTAPTAAAREKVSALPNNIVNIVFAELFGTFVLTLVALLTFKETAALYVGLTVAVMVMAIGAVSGSHLNPAVTFGLFAMRKLKLILVPFYWLAQLLGALLAMVVVNSWLTSTGISSHIFDHFGNMNWSIFGVEVIGMAVFMFGLAAAVSRADFSPLTRALGVGFSLMVGLLVGGSLLASIQAAVDTSKITSVSEVPNVLRIKGAVLNPAVALAVNEATDSSFTGTRPAKAETQYSRFGLEVILGSLIGAALGGNLWLLVAGRRRS